MEEKKNLQTPQEIEQALDRLADKLEEMDKAEGVFGEALTDEDLEDVAGGIQPKVSEREEMLAYYDTDVGNR